MNNEIRKQIDMIKNVKQNLNEHYLDNLNIDLVKKIYEKLKSVDFEWDYSVMKNSLLFNIVTGGLSLKDDEILYNTNKEYQMLFDKDRDNIISEIERERMYQIYALETKKIQSKLILYYYNKNIKNNEQKGFTNWVEKTFFVTQ